jgi:hypothetical protein
MKVFSNQMKTAVEIEFAIAMLFKGSDRFNYNLLHRDRPPPAAT